MLARSLLLLCLCACVVGLTGPVYASPATVTFESGLTCSISKVAGNCNGSEMAGMSVTIDYQYGGKEYSPTLYWTKSTGSQVAGVYVYYQNQKAPIISLSEGTDTFKGSWTLKAGKGVTLEEVSIDGFPGKTVFDTTFNNKEGTIGSGKGKDAKATSSLPKGATVAFTYADLVALQGSTGPVGDLYRMLDINFSGTKVSSLVFQADTAQASPVPVPPGLVLISSGILFLWGVRKRAGVISSRA